jgi:hypothetical protein
MVGRVVHRLSFIFLLEKAEGRRKKAEGRRKKVEGRRKKGKDGYEVFAVRSIVSSSPGYSDTSRF